MIRARWTSLEVAAASVPDGASVVPGGFMLGRAPMALVFALVRAGRKNLHVLSLPNPLTSRAILSSPSRFLLPLGDQSGPSAISTPASRALPTSAVCP